MEKDRLVIRDFRVIDTDVVKLQESRSDVNFCVLGSQGLSM